MDLDVPDGWEVATLGDLYDFSNGVNTDKSAYGSGIPFINVLEVITHETLDDALIPGRVTLPPAVAVRYQVRHGDALFNRTSETQDEVALSSVYLGESDIVFGGFVLRGRPKNKRLETAYAPYALRAQHVRQQIIARGQGGIRANIGQRDLKTVLILLPGPEEQRVIANVLADAHRQVTTIECLLSKKQFAKQGMMQQLLTGRTRLPGFTDDWCTASVGSFARVTSGGTPSTSVPRYWGGSIRWMSSGELHQKRVSEVAGRITEDGLHESSAQLVPAGTVLIGLAGQGKTRGTVAVSRVELTTNQSIAGILPSPDHVPDFLYYNLDMRYDELRAMSTGEGGRGGLNLSIIRSVPVSMPDMPEQEAIANALRDVDDELDLLRARLAKAQGTKQGVMQQLLTGRTRLPVPEATL